MIWLLTSEGELVNLALVSRVYVADGFGQYRDGKAREAWAVVALLSNGATVALSPPFGSQQDARDVVRRLADHLRTDARVPRTPVLSIEDLMPSMPQAVGA